MSNEVLSKAQYCIYLSCIVLAFVGPGVAQDDLVLAQIENQKIVASEFRSYTEKIPKAYTAGKTGAEADRVLLNGLIDKKLMLAEAKRVGIADQPEFNHKLELFAQAQVIKFYQNLEIEKKISISSEEMMQHYRDSRRDRALRYAGMLVESKAKAEELLAEIAAGADFGQLAKIHSLYEKTRDKGGDVGEYILIDDTAPQLRSIYTMEVDQVSQPLPWDSGGKARHVIVKILDENPVPFEDVAQVVREEVFAKKRLERSETLGDSLAGIYAPQIDYDKIDAVLARLALLPNERAETPEAGTEVLCRYNGGVITIDDFVLSVPEQEEGYSRDYQSAWLIDHLQDVAIPNRMFLLEASGRGLDEDPTILARVENERGDMLVSVLRKRAVMEQMPPVTDAEARAFYDQNPEKFMGFENIVITEILVAFKEQAQSLKEELAAGADGEQLAADYTIRQKMGHHAGQLTISPIGLNRDLYRVAKDLQVGDVGGPVKLKDGYSVFKVLEKKAAPKKPYHAFSQRRARAYVRIGRSQNAFVEYIRGLRQRYSVKVFEENLMKMQPGEAVEEG